MLIKEIEIENFRNIDHVILREINDEMNIICGNNAQGKTNLLEAIYFLCSGKSFRTRDDKEAVMFNRQSTRLQGKIEYNERDFEVNITFGLTEKKRIYVNDVKQKAIMQMPFTVVLFCPEDLELARGAAALRRKWLDNTISQLRPKYAETLTTFRKLYDSKLKILKEFKEKPDLLNVLGEFNTQLAMNGAILIQYRAAYVEKLTPLVTKMQKSLANEQLSLTFKTIDGITNAAEMKPSELATKLAEKQAEVYDAELASGQCLSGAQRDDVTPELNGKTYEFWSQGQTRTIVMALKLAEREFIKQETEEWPLLLLDDVLSELDDSRQRFLLGTVSSGQTFVTCCDAAKRPTRRGQLIPVHGGTIN
jgi:DNA replication and repair protein RecF